MRNWLMSVGVAALAINMLQALPVVRQWQRAPFNEAATLLERASLLLQGLSKERRNRLNSIERVVDFRPDDPIRKLGSGVGLLSVAYRDDKGSSRKASCTAAVVTPGLLLTAHHCVFHQGKEIDSAEIWFGHLAQNAADVFPAGEIVASDEELDFALLTVRLPAQHPAGAALPNLPLRPPIPGERVLIIHHGQGDVQQLSRAFCRIAIDQDDKPWVIHTCPTAPGSSGALLIAESDHALLALHAKASLSSPLTLGYATPLTAITKEAKEMVEYFKRNPRP